VARVEITSYALVQIHIQLLFKIARVYFLGAINFSPIHLCNLSLSFVITLYVCVCVCVCLCVCTVLYVTSKIKFTYSLLVGVHSVMHLHPSKSIHVFLKELTAWRRYRLHGLTVVKEFPLLMKPDGTVFTESRYWS
jgi:hypothetical protein